MTANNNPRTKPHHMLFTGPVLSEHDTDENCSVTQNSLMLRVPGTTSTRNGANTARSTNRSSFSTANMPANLDDRARKQAWLDYCEHAIKLRHDMISDGDIPFFAHVELTWFDELMLCSGRTSATQILRTKQHIAADRADSFFLVLNEGNEPMWCETPRGQVELRSGMLGFLSASEPLTCFKAPGSVTHIAIIARSALSELIRSPDDHAPNSLVPNLPATWLLKDYLQLLLRPKGFESDPAVNTHVNRSLTDLLALALGTGRNEAELAMLRGGRAAKLELVLEGIQSGFHDPDFSERVLAARFGIAPRTIRDLLFETGVTFSERVLELRLQKARDMLTNPRCNHMKVGDIAYACGFNEVPYFNRRFRRRFGASPTQLRA